MLFHFFLISAISEQVPYRRTFHTDCHTCQVLQGAHSPRCIIRIHKGEMQRFKLSWEACLQLGLPEKSAEQWGSGHTAYLSSQNKMTNLGSFSLSLSLFSQKAARDPDVHHLKAGGSWAQTPDFANRFDTLHPIWRHMWKMEVGWASMGSLLACF